MPGAGSSSPSPLSMDALSQLPFDQLLGLVHRPPAGHLEAAAPRPGPAPPDGAAVPDHAKEVDVYFCSSAGGDLPAPVARELCRGKQDSSTLEPLDEALDAGQRVVITAAAGTKPRELARGQVHLAASLARWLRESKVDGEGRPYGETQNTDPLLVKLHFTRAQIKDIYRFACGGS